MPKQSKLMERVEDALAKLEIAGGPVRLPYFSRADLVIITHTLAPILLPIEALPEKWRTYKPRPSTPISEAQHECAAELDKTIRVGL